MGTQGMQNVLYYIGALTSTYAFFRTCKFLHSQLRPSQLPRYLHGGNKDVWALVTGASDGIGQGFAQELCRQGFNVILHGRNKQKLEKVAAGLVSEYPSRQTQLFVADAGSPDTFDNSLDMIKELNLTVLVNNVGGEGHLRTAFMPLHELTSEELETTINLNLGFTTQLTRALLPTLIRNEPSLVLNTGSVTVMGFPWLVAYSASKGFLASFSRALRTEMVAIGKDVRVHNLVVGSVSSGTRKVKTDPFCPSSRALAKAALRRAGAGSVNMVPWLGHRLQLFFLGMLPETLVQRSFIKAIIRESEGMRKLG